MKAIGFRTAGSIHREDALIDIDIPKPEPGPRDLIVRVQAVSVNPVDAKVRANAQPAEGQARILGFDAAGIVEAIGSDVTLFAPGDEVFYAGDINRPGSYAEYQAVDERIVGHKPATLDWAEAAALPLTAITAWELLFDRFRLPPPPQRGSGRLLILNGAGGVGSIMIQLARQLTDCVVIASASRPETEQHVRAMGAHHVVDHRAPLDTELARIGVEQVDYVAKLTDDDSQTALLAKVMAPQGCLAMITASKALDPAAFMPKSITLAWELMFTRPMFATPDMIRQHELLDAVARLIDAGHVRTTMTERLSPIDAATLRRAHQAIETGRTIGKIALTGF